MGLPSYSKGQGNSVFENVSSRVWKMRVLAIFQQHRTKQAGMIRKHPSGKWSSLAKGQERTKEWSGYNWEYRLDQHYHYFHCCCLLLNKL